MYCYLPQIVLNVYILMPQTAKLSGMTLHDAAESHDVINKQQARMMTSQ
jgi:hypothetical protein